MEGPKEPKEESYFARICTEECGGLCCDPWWGIISYTIVKDDGLKKLKSFKTAVLKGISEREQRIRSAYVTSEETPRALFGPPERYNVKVTGIRSEGGALKISLLAMFAFSCRHFTDQKSCAIHPSFMDSREIRPMQCGLLGSPKAKPRERGYCRIIEAGETDTAAAVASAIAVEKEASAKHYADGVLSAELAAERVMDALNKYAAAERKEPETAVKPGRNDPCPCGSGRKFKKCHGA